MAVIKEGIDAVDNRPDFPALEREVLAWWKRDGIVEKYLHRNDAAPSATRSSMGRSRRTTRWVSITPGAGPTRICTSAIRRCSATNSVGRKASTAKGCGSRSRSRRSSASRPSATSRQFGIAEFVERCKERVLTIRRPHHRAVDPPRLLDGLGQLVLHDVGREQLHHLALPQDCATSVAGSTRATM